MRHPAEIEEGSQSEEEVRIGMATGRGARLTGGMSGIEEMKVGVCGNVADWAMRALEEGKTIWIVRGRGEDDVGGSFCTTNTACTVSVTEIGMDALQGV